MKLKPRCCLHVLLGKSDIQAYRGGCWTVMRSCAVFLSSSIKMSPQVVGSSSLLPPGVMFQSEAASFNFNIDKSPAESFWDIIIIIIKKLDHHRAATFSLLQPPSASVSLRSAFSLQFHSSSCRALTSCRPGLASCRGRLWLAACSVSRATCPQKINRSASSASAFCSHTATGTKPLRCFVWYCTEWHVSIWTALFLLLALQKQT